MGRPKIKWDSLTYDDYDFDQLDKIKNKQINKIKSLQKKIDKIDIEIKKLQKQSKKLELAKLPTQNTIDNYKSDLDKISLVIDQKSKIFTKKNNTITLINSEKSIRGKISYFGRTVWVHIGSKHKKGLVHKHTLIGSMTNDQLCDEFRYKAKIKIQSSWVLH
ncbi:MAG: hypothetical protein ACJZ15_08310 [Candidatus Neomarinimicrobiota bacterium]|tara:strand:+ start:1216 stop:1701 length:486 start_codon:yes stop_codon:yes gene_type:complete